MKRFINLILHIISYPKNILVKILISNFNKNKSSTSTLEEETIIENKEFNKEDKEDTLMEEFALLIDKVLLITSKEKQDYYKLEIKELLTKYKTRYLEIASSSNKEIILSFDNELKLKGDIITSLVSIEYEIDELLTKEKIDK